MNLGEARAELTSRGFDFEDPNRLNIFLNDANHELQEFASWPWLETTVSGTAPLLIPDLRDVLFVKDTTSGQELEGEDVRDITDWDPANLATGNPMSYWLDSETVNVWPVNTTDQLTVRYLQVAPDVLQDTDTPTFPQRYSTLWVTIAQARLLFYDNSNDSYAAQMLQQTQAGLQNMANVLSSRMYDNPTRQVLTNDIDSTLYRGMW